MTKLIVLITVEHTFSRGVARISFFSTFFGGRGGLGVGGWGKHTWASSWNDPTAQKAKHSLQGVGSRVTLQWGRRT